MSISLPHRDPQQQADALFQTLGGHRTPSGYTLHCPSHDDRTPSLSVTVKGETLLVHCHAACSQEAVLAALSARGVWGRSGSPIPPPARRSPPSSPTPAPAVSPAESSDNPASPPAPAAPLPVPLHPSGAQAIYVYLDEHRRAVHRTVRFPHKQFRQHHYRNGRWYSGLGDRIVLYNLPDLLQADPSKAVFLTEGEKDAESFIRKGMLATTVPCGASAWPPECARWLRDRTVVVLGDNDRAGREGALRRAQALQGIAQEVKVYTFPGLPEGADATDWLALRQGKGNLAQDLMQTVDQAAAESNQQEAAADDGPVPQIMHVDQVVPEPIDWLWRPYLARGKLHMLDGDPGVRKSYAMLSLAAQLSRGIPLGSGDGAAPAGPPGLTLLLPGEDDLADTIRPRLDTLQADATRIKAVTGVVHQGKDSPLWLDESGVIALEKAIKLIAPDLVIIDPLVAFLGARLDMNRSNEVRAMLRPLADLAKRYNCAVVALRHLTKAFSLHALYRGQGSIDFSAHARSALLMGKDPEDPDRSILVPIKTNIGLLGHAQALRLTGEGRDTRLVWEGAVEVTSDDLLGGAEGEGHSARKEAEDFLLDRLAGAAASAAGLLKEARAAGIAEATLKRAKTRLRLHAQRHGVPGGKPGDGIWTWELPSS